MDEEVKQIEEKPTEKATEPKIDTVTNPQKQYQGVIYGGIPFTINAKSKDWAEGMIEGQAQNLKEKIGFVKTRLEIKEVENKKK